MSKKGPVSRQATILTRQTTADHRRSPSGPGTRAGARGTTVLSHRLHPESLLPELHQIFIVVNSADGVCLHSDFYRSSYNTSGHPSI